MGLKKYRVHVELSKQLPQTNSLYTLCMTYIVRAATQVDQLPEWMKETAVNHLCSKLAEARALACSWMNDRGEP